MDMNSANQLWTKWTFTITPGGNKRPGFLDVKTSSARFAGRYFGSVAAMKIEEFPGQWRIQVRAEGHPAQDGHYVRFIRQAFRNFFTIAFGTGTRVDLQTEIQAGDPGDGSPRRRLIFIEGIGSTAQTRM